MATQKPKNWLEKQQQEREAQTTASAKNSTNQSGSKTKPKNWLEYQQQGGQYTYSAPRLMSYSWSNKSSTKEMSFAEYFAWGQHTGKGQDYFDAAIAATQNPASRYYNPYLGNKTTQTGAAQFFAEKLGYTGPFDDNFFEQFRDLRAYETRSPITGLLNQPSAKKGTDAEWAAYYYNQLWMDKEIQQSADTEFADLRSYAQNWFDTQKKLYGKNPTVDDFLKAIDISKYKTLAKIDASRNPLGVESSAVVQLNLGTNYSKESLYGLYNVLSNDGRIDEDRDYFDDAVEYFSRPMQTPEVDYLETLDLAGNPKLVEEFSNFLRAGGHLKELVKFQNAVYKQMPHMDSVETESYFGDELHDNDWFALRHSQLDSVLAGMTLPDGSIRKPTEKDPPIYHAAYELYEEDQKRYYTDLIEQQYQKYRTLVMNVDREQYATFDDYVLGVEEYVASLGYDQELNELFDYISGKDFKLCRPNFIPQAEGEYDENAVKKLLTPMLEAAYGGFDIASNNIDYSLATFEKPVDARAEEGPPLASPYAPPVPAVTPASSPSPGFADTMWNLFASASSYLISRGVDIVSPPSALDEPPAPSIEPTATPEPVRLEKSYEFGPDGIITTLVPPEETPVPDIVAEMADQTERQQAADNGIQLNEDRKAISDAVLSMADSGVPISESEIIASGMLLLPDGITRDSAIPSTILALWRDFNASKYEQLLGPGYKPSAAVAADPVLKALGGSAKEPIAPVTLGGIADASLELNALTYPGGNFSIASGVLDIVVPESLELSRLLNDISLNLDPDVAQRVSERPFDVRAYADAVAEAHELNITGRAAAVYGISKMGLVSDLVAVFSSNEKLPVNVQQLATELASPEAIHNIALAFGSPEEFIKAQAIIGDGKPTDVEGASMLFFTGLLTGLSRYSDPAHQIATEDLLHDIAAGDITNDDIRQGLVLASTSLSGSGPILPPPPPSEAAEPSPAAPSNDLLEEIGYDEDADYWENYGKFLGYIDSFDELPDEAPPSIPAPSYAFPVGANIPKTKDEAYDLLYKNADIVVASLNEQHAEVSQELSDLMTFSPDEDQQRAAEVEAAMQLLNAKYPNGGAEYEAQVNALGAKYDKESRASELQQQLTKLEGKMDELQSFVFAAQGRQKFDPIAAAPDFNEFSAPLNTVFDDSTDMLFGYINNLGDARKIADSIDYKDMKGVSSFSKYAYMTPEEIGMFNYLSQKPGMEGLVDEYLKHVIYDVEAREAEVVKAKVKGWVSKGLLPTLGANAYSVIQNIQSGFGALALLGEHVRNIHGDEYHPLHMDSIAQMPGIVAGTIREETAKYMPGVVWPFVYQTVMSGIDSLAAGVVGGQYGGGLILGASAAQSTMQAAHDKGATDSQIMSLGLAAGAFESIFESISLGAFYNSQAVLGKGGFKAFALDFLAQGGINASEEAATEIANILYDYSVMGDKSDFGLAVQEYITGGMEEKDARAQAVKDMVLRVAEAGGSGALMGFGFSFIGAAGRGINQSTQARQAKAFSDSDVFKTFYGDALSGKHGEEAKGFASKLDSTKPDPKLMYDMQRSAQQNKQQQMAQAMADAKHSVAVEIVDALEFTGDQEEFEDVVINTPAPVKPVHSKGWDTPPGNDTEWESPAETENKPESVETQESTEAKPTEVSAEPAMDAAKPEAEISAPEAPVIPAPRTIETIAAEWSQLQLAWHLGQIPPVEFDTKNQAFRDEFKAYVREQTERSTNMSVEAEPVVEAPVAQLESPAVAPVQAAPQEQTSVVTASPITPGAEKVAEFVEGSLEDAAVAADMKELNDEKEQKLIDDEGLKKFAEQIEDADREVGNDQMDADKLNEQAVDLNQRLIDARRAGVDEGIDTTNNPKFLQSIQNLMKTIQSNASDLEQANAKRDKSQVNADAIRAKRDAYAAELEESLEADIRKELAARKETRAAEYAQQYLEQSQVVGSKNATDDAVNPNPQGPDYAPQNGGNVSLESIAQGKYNKAEMYDTPLYEKNQKRGDEDVWDVNPEEDVDSTGSPIRTGNRMTEVGKEVFDKKFADYQRTHGGASPDPNDFIKRSRPVGTEGGEPDTELSTIETKAQEKDVHAEYNKDDAEKEYNPPEPISIGASNTPGYSPYLEGNGYVIYKNNYTAEDIKGYKRDLDDINERMPGIEDHLHSLQDAEAKAEAAMNAAPGDAKLKKAYLDAVAARKKQGYDRYELLKKKAKLDALMHTPLEQYIVIRKPTENIGYTGPSRDEITRIKVGSVAAEREVGQLKNDIRILGKKLIELKDKRSKQIPYAQIRSKLAPAKAAVEKAKAPIYELAKSASDAQKAYVDYHDSVVVFGVAIPKEEMKRLGAYRYGAQKAKAALEKARTAYNQAVNAVNDIQKALSEFVSLKSLQTITKATKAELSQKESRLAALEGQLYYGQSDIKGIKANAIIRNALAASELDSGSAAYFNYLLAVDEAKDSAKQKYVGLKKNLDEHRGNLTAEAFPDYIDLFDRGLSQVELYSLISEDIYYKTFKEDLPKNLASLAKSVNDSLRVRNKDGKVISFNHAAEAKAWAKENGIAVPESTQEYETRYFIRESSLYENDADRFAADVDERIEQSEKPDRNPTTIMLDGMKYDIADQDGGTMLLFPADAQSKDGMISSVRTVDDAVKCINKIYDSIAKERAENSAKWQGAKKGSLDYENALSFRVWNPDAEWNEGEYDEKSDADANKLRKNYGKWEFVKLGGRSSYALDDRYVIGSRYFTDLASILASPSIHVRYGKGTEAENFILVNKQQMKWKEGTDGGDSIAYEQAVSHILSSRLADMQKAFSSDSLTVSEFRTMAKEYLDTLILLDKKYVMDDLDKLMRGATGAQAEVIKNEIRRLEAEIKAIKGAQENLDDLMEKEIPGFKENPVHRAAREENQKPSGPMYIQYFARKGGGELKRYYKKAHSEVTAKATEIQNDPHMLDDQRSALLRVLGKRGEELQRQMDALAEAGVTDSSPSEWEDERVAGEQASEKAERDWRLLDQQMSQEADAKHDLETIVNSLIYYDPSNPIAEGDIAHYRAQLNDFAERFDLDVEGATRLLNALVDLRLESMPSYDRLLTYYGMARQAEAEGDTETLEHVNQKIEEAVLGPSEPSESTPEQSIEEGAGTAQEGAESPTEGSGGPNPPTPPEIPPSAKLTASQQAQIQQTMNQPPVSEAGSPIEVGGGRYDYEALQAAGKDKNNPRPPSIIFEEVAKVGSALDAEQLIINDMTRRKKAIEDKLFNNGVKPETRAKMISERYDFRAQIDTLGDQMEGYTNKRQMLTEQNEQMFEEQQANLVEVESLRQGLANPATTSEWRAEYRNRIAKLYEKNQAIAVQRKANFDEIASLNNLYNTAQRKRELYIMKADRLTGLIYERGLSRDERLAMVKELNGLNKDRRDHIKERNRLKEERSRLATEYIVQDGVLNSMLEGDAFLNPKKIAPNVLDDKDKYAHTSPEVAQYMIKLGNDAWAKLKPLLERRLRDKSHTSFTFQELSRAIESVISAEYFKLNKAMADALRFQLYEVNQNVLHAEIELCALRDLAGVADIGEKAEALEKLKQALYREYDAKKTFEKQDVDALAQIRFDEMLTKYQKTYAGKSKEEINSERAALKDEYLPRMKTYIENGTRAMKALYRDSSEGGTAMFKSEGGHYPTYVKAIVGAAFREIADNKRNPGGLLQRFYQNPREYIANIARGNEVAAAFLNSLYIDPALRAEADMAVAIDKYIQRAYKAGLDKDIAVDVFDYVEGGMNSTFLLGIDDPIRRELVRGAGEELKSILADVLEETNSYLVSNGADPIVEHADYMPHVLKSMGIIKLIRRAQSGVDRRAEQTGKTKEHTGTKPFNMHALSRTAKENTEYTHDAVEALRRHVHSMMRQAYMTAPTTRIVDLVDFLGRFIDRNDDGTVRYSVEENPGETKGKNSQGRLPHVINFLIGYGKQLEQRNMAFDYDARNVFGAGIYTLADYIKKKRSQALIWGNKRSAFMNLTALIQSLSVNRQHTLGAICQVSFDMIFRQDEFKKFERESIHLRTLGMKDPFRKTAGKVIAKYGMIAATTLDRFARNVAVRAMYNEGRSKGYSHSVALQRADMLVHNMLTTKTPAGSANMYTGKVTSTIFQFTQEPLNTILWYANMLPKTVDKPEYVLAMVLWMLGAWLFNQRIGSNALPEPISAITGFVQRRKNDEDVVSASLYAFNDAINPFNRLFSEGMGGIPLVGGLEDAWQGIKAIPGAFDEDEEKAGNSRRDIAEAVLGFVSFGAAANKAYTGITTVNQGYAETRDGMVKHEVAQTPENYIKAAFLGVSATDEGREYNNATIPTMFNERSSPLSDSQSAEFRRLVHEVGMEVPDALATVLRSTETNMAQSRGEKLDKISDPNAEPYLTKAAEVRSGMTLPSGLVEWAYEDENEPYMQNVIKLWKDSGNTSILPKGFTFSKIVNEEEEEITYVEYDNFVYILTDEDIAKFEQDYRNSYRIVMGAAYSEFGGNVPKILSQLDSNRTRIIKKHIERLREVD